MNLCIRNILMQIKEINMSKRICFLENGIYLVIEVQESGEVSLLHFSSVPFQEMLINENDKNKYNLIELQVSGENHNTHHSTKHIRSSHSNKLKYKEHKDYRNNYGRKLEIFLESEDFSAVYNMQFYNNISVASVWTEIKNISLMSKGIDYISTFALTGISKEWFLEWEKKSRLHIPHNSWKQEVQWISYSLPELGLNHVDEFSLKRISCCSKGTFSSSEFLPSGCFENIECNTFLFWQIEHNGAWQWELSDIGNQLYLQLSGPTENESYWWKSLQPGEAFVTVPAAISAVSGSFENAVCEITKYRRIIRRDNEDNKTMPVIFNDYMNCLFANPSTEKELPLIDAAAEAGCEYYCIDDGWFCDEPSWLLVGEWQPAKTRFTNGLQQVIDYIIEKGMVPGLWLELEVVGINSPLVKSVPDTWFFKRHGKPVIDNGRFQLDYRNPEVIEHANEVINRLVNEYGIGYIKMDYNINAGIGTEENADSFGEGLLQHNRAYLNWIDSVFQKYPNLIIEACASGGMRMDYALLKRHSIQSCSDNTNYRDIAVIAAACSTAVTPEQAAIWSYPLKDGDVEEVIFNMVSTMLLRIHQSGQLAEISSDRFAYVKEGIECYKRIRKDIPDSLPFWPLGVPRFSDGWISFGLNCGKKKYLAVWRRHGHECICSFPLKVLKEKGVSVKCLYPAKNEFDFLWNAESSSLVVSFDKQYTARLFELEEVL